MIFQFGGFHLDTRLLELRRENAPVHIEPQVFDLLRLLIENRDRIVGKDEIIDAVWDGRIVSEATMSSRMSAARRAVGDDGRRQEVIRTLPRRGFRFVAPVAVDNEARSTTDSAEPHGEREAALDIADEPSPPSDQPSIAVMPFANVSGDPEQEYFADGIAEDIITALSQFRQFFVIARNSSFTYKGLNIDVRHVGRELGVRYILEGSVRKGGNRLRITAQLVEAATGNNLWAERYDGAFDDVFDLQDRITEGVVGAIEPNIRRAEIERSRRKRPESLDAYDLYLRALPHFWANTATESVKAVALLDEALRIDPSYGAAHGLAALCHMLRFAQGGLDPLEKASAIDHARTVLALGADDANALAFAGIVIANLEHDLGVALSAVEKAVALNPNSARSHANMGWVQMLAGHDDAAIESTQRSIRLSPFDPFNFGPESTLSILYFRKGRFEESLEAARRSIRSNASFVVGHHMLVASCVRAGRAVEAQDAVRRLLEIHPQYRIESVRHVGSSGPEQDVIIAALREAGLPE